MIENAVGEEHAETLVGGGEGIAGPGEQAVELEGAVREGGTAPATDANLVSWLFRPEEPAQKFDLSRLSDIISHHENLAWIDATDFTENQFRNVAAMLDLQHSEIHTALSAWQRPRLEVYDDHFFVSVTVSRLDPAERQIQAGELDLFVGENYLFSAHKQAIPFAGRVLARATNNPELVRLDSAYMLYIILDELLSNYEELYERIQMDVEHMEERALTDTSEDFLQDVVRFKRYTGALNQLVDQHRQVFTAFLRPDFRYVSGDDIAVYYRDLDNRLQSLVDTLRGARDAVNGAFEIYVSHVSHRTDQTVKVLTMVSTVFLPISVILAVFNTGFVQFYNGVGLTVMIALIVSVVIGTIYAFRRQGWL
jgi:magnesium transporter